jgi:hypothetical protein
MSKRIIVPSTYSSPGKAFGVDDHMKNFVCACFASSYGRLLLLHNKALRKEELLADEEREFNRLFK